MPAAVLDAVAWTPSGWCVRFEAANGAAALGEHLVHSPGKEQLPVPEAANATSFLPAQPGASPARPAATLLVERSPAQSELGGQGLHFANLKPIAFGEPRV